MRARKAPASRIRHPNSRPDAVSRSLPTMSRLAAPSRSRSRSRSDWAMRAGGIDRGAGASDAPASRSPTRSCTRCPPRARRTRSPAGRRNRAGGSRVRALRERGAGGHHSDLSQPRPDPAPRVLVLAAEILRDQTLSGQVAGRGPVRQARRGHARLQHPRLDDRLHPRGADAVLRQDRRRRRPRLRDLPAGSYELHAWHPQQRAPAEARSLVLDAGSALRADFVLDAFPRKAKYKPPMDRLKY